MIEIERMAWVVRYVYMLNNMSMCTCLALNLSLLPILIFSGMHFFLCLNNYFLFVGIVDIILAFVYQIPSCI